jgi:hypothetical protein
MRGLIISNPRLEFLRPALERWFDCIDRYNEIMGDSECVHWHDERTNLGLLSSAAWMAEMVTLEQAPSKKQHEDGDRNGRTDLFLATKEDKAYLHASQRWPTFGALDMMPALLDAASDAKKLSHPNHLRIGCLFVTPWKAKQSASPEQLEDWVDDLQKQNTCALAWYFPYNYRKLHNEDGQYFPGIALMFKAA